MNQDGSDKKDPNAPSDSAPTPGGRGKLILTFCLPTGQRAAYPRAVVPFPESRAATLKTVSQIFSAYFGTPSNKKFFALALAVKTHDGDTQWAEIAEGEATWAAVVSPGDEVGVLFGTPNDRPVDVPYTPTGQAVPTRQRQPPNAQRNDDSKDAPKNSAATPSDKKLLKIMCTVDGQETLVMITTHSLSECQSLLLKQFNKPDKGSSPLFGGSMQISAEVEFEGKKVWSVIADASSFSRLLGMRQEPIQLRARFVLSNPGRPPPSANAPKFNFTKPEDLKFNFTQAEGNAMPKFQFTPQPPPGEESKCPTQ